MTNQQNSQMNDWIRQRMRDRSQAIAPPTTPSVETPTLQQTIAEPQVGGSAVDTLLRNEEDAALHTIVTHMEFQRVIRRIRTMLRNPDGVARFVADYTECRRAREGVFIPESWHNFCMCWLWLAIIEGNVSVDGIERLWFGIFHAANDDDFDQAVWIEAGLQDRLPPAYVQNLLREQSVQSFTDPSLGATYPAAVTQPMSTQLQTLATLSAAAVMSVDDIAGLPVFAELVAAVRGLVFNNGVRASSAIEGIVDRLRMQFAPLEASDAIIVNAAMQLPAMQWFLELLSTRDEASRALLLTRFLSTISEWAPAPLQTPCELSQVMEHGTAYLRVRSLRDALRVEVLIRTEDLDYVSNVLLMTTHRRNVMNCVMGIWRDIDIQHLPLSTLSELDFGRLSTLLSSPAFEYLRNTMQQHPWIMAECQQELMGYIIRNFGERREEFTAGLRFLESAACQECVEDLIRLGNAGGRTVLAMLIRIVWNGHPSRPVQWTEPWVQPNAHAVELVDEFANSQSIRVFEMLDNMSLNCLSFVLRVMLDAATGESSIVQALTACDTHGLTDQHRLLSFVNTGGDRLQLDGSLFLGTVPDLAALRHRREHFRRGNWCVVTHTNLVNGRSHYVHVCVAAHAAAAFPTVEAWAESWRMYHFPSMCEPSTAALEFWDTETVIEQHEAALADLMVRTNNGQHAPVPPTSEVFDAVVHAADEGMSQIAGANWLVTNSQNGEVVEQYSIPTHPITGRPFTMDDIAAAASQAGQLEVHLEPAVPASQVNRNSDVVPPLTQEMVEQARQIQRNSATWRTPDRLTVPHIRSQPNMDIREVLASNPLRQTQPAPLRTFEEAMQALAQHHPVQIGTPYELPLPLEQLQRAVAAGAVSRATLNSMVNATTADAAVQSDRVNAVVAAMQTPQEHAAAQLPLVLEAIRRNNLAGSVVTDRQAAVQNLVADVADSMRIDSQAVGNVQPNGYVTEARSSRGIQVTGGTITGLQTERQNAAARPEFTGRVIQSTIRWDITDGSVTQAAHVSEWANLLANSIPVPPGVDPAAARNVTVRPVNVHDALSKLYDRSAGPSLFDLALIAAYRRIHPVVETPPVADHVRVVQLRRSNDR